MIAIIELVSHPVQLSRFAAGLVDASLKSLVVLALAGGLCLCWRRASAANRHLVWLLAILSLPWLALLCSASPWHRPAWSVSTELVSGNQVSMTLILAPTANANLTGSSAGPQTSQAEAATPPDGTPAQTPALATRFDAGWLELTLAVWLAGVLLVLFSIVAGHLRLRTLRRQSGFVAGQDWIPLLNELRTALGIVRPVLLLRSKNNVMPVTWGCRRPVILLPAEADHWTPERRRVVLMHELAHVRRWDCLTQLAARMVCALFWLNPLVWVAARRLCVERERACDDLVLNGGWRPSDYARHLLDIARSYQRVPQAAGIAMARPRGLERRLLAIVDPRRNRRQAAKTTAAFMTIALAGIGFLLGDSMQTSSNRSAWFLEESPVAGELKSFVAEKRAYATAAIEADEKEMLPEISALFDAAEKGDWPAINKLWRELRERVLPHNGAGPKEDIYRSPAWPVLMEIQGAFGQIAAAEREVVAFARDIIELIPPGSIYFGGTDPGRFVITALQTSHLNADPFFTLTQNALADGYYLDYLRVVYEGKIYIPTDQDSEKCFTKYLTEAKRRFEAGELKPGEVVTEEDGKVKISGQVAVMGINACLARIIFDRNPDREFYIEQSYPIEWMYPHLSPHGPIMKVNREPLAQLPEEMVQRDREYWTHALEPWIGDWLQYDTPVQTVAAFAREVTFPPGEGDPDAPQADSGAKWISHLRTSIAGIYIWRMRRAPDEAEQARMAGEADFALRQALAVHPYSPAAVHQYVSLLTHQERFADARLVIETALELDPGNPNFRDRVEQIEK